MTRNLTQDYFLPVPVWRKDAMSTLPITKQESPLAPMRAECHGISSGHSATQSGGLKSDDAVPPPDTRSSTGTAAHEGMYYDTSIKWGGKTYSDYVQGKEFMLMCWPGTEDLT